MRFTLIDALLYPFGFFSTFEFSNVLIVAGIPLLAGGLLGWGLKQKATTVMLAVLAALYLCVTLPFYFERVGRNDWLSFLGGPVILCLFAGVAIGKLIRKLTAKRA